MTILTITMIMKTIMGTIIIVSKIENFIHWLPTQ
jgi:hypothetical protein